jgi:hypothetical protein
MRRDAGLKGNGTKLVGAAAVVAGEFFGHAE